jgi:DNA-binding HxlR family transcriptional regulator
MSEVNIDLNKRLEEFREQRLFSEYSVTELLQQACKVADPMDVWNQCKTLVD